MKKSVTIISGLTLLVFTSSFVTKNNGLEGRTGSPGETTCNTSGCHTGNTINAAPGSLVINAPTMSNWEYEPGVTYPIEVTITRSGSPKFGIGFEALQASGANGGTISITDPASTQLKTAVFQGNSRTNLVHTINGGATANSKTFSFNWTAPATAIGNITFYAAGNASNGLNNTSGDFIYTSSRVLTPVSGVSVEETALSNNFVAYYDHANHNITLNFTSSDRINAEITLTDHLGRRLITTNKLNFESGQQTYTLSLPSEIRSGIYILNLNSGKQSATKKLFILP